MAAEVLPPAQLKLPSGPSPVTAEQRYWSSFKNPRSHTSTAEWPISHISFPPPAAAAANDSFAVTSGPRVDLYSIRKRDLVKTVGRFDSQAFGAEIRSDGKVLIAGENSGKMQVFDVAAGTRVAILKTWHVHKQPVWVTKWDPSNRTTIMSASDDKTVRLWSLPSNEPTTTLHGHGDYVRSGAFVPGANGNIIVSGSYDQSVRVWDARTSTGAVLTFQHKNPIEEVLPLPSGSSVLAASGNAISVLDLVAAKPLRLITNHQKTVTSLCLATHGTRVVSGGLDGHVKVFDTTNFNVVASSKYPSPILSLSVISAGANHDDRHLAVGMQSGVLALRTRLTGVAAAKQRNRASEQAARDSGQQALEELDAKRAKRKRAQPSQQAQDLLGRRADAVIETSARQHGKKRAAETAWQRDLRYGRFGAALDAVVDIGAPGYQPLTALTVLTTLRHRSGLRTALEGRDEVSVLPVLRWVTKYLIDPAYAPVCVDVALHLLDLYGEYVGASAELAVGFKYLLDKVRMEVDKAQCAVMTNGMVESLMMGAMVV